MKAWKSRIARMEIGFNESSRSPELIVVRLSGTRDEEIRGLLLKGAMRTTVVEDLDDEPTVESECLERLPGESLTDLEARALRLLRDRGVPLPQVLLYDIGR